MAIKIFRISDRIKLKIEDISLVVSPLNYQQKVEVQSCGTSASKGSTPKVDVNRMMRLVIKYCVKGIDGLETINGEPYELEFEDDGKTKLSDECVEELLTIPVSQKMIISLMGLMAGIPKDNKIRDPETGKVLEGVEILLKNECRGKGKKKRK